MGHKCVRAYDRELQYYLKKGIRVTFYKVVVYIFTIYDKINIRELHEVIDQDIAGYEKGVMIDMENERLSTEEIVQEYKEDVHKLIKYIPWLESKIGENLSDIYTGENIASTSIAFPVYDSTLLSFVKDARSTVLMDKNYQYAYSKYGMRTPQDEKRAIERAKITQMQLLRGILSKYILRGMTKSTVWTEGVQNGVLLQLLLKMRELIEFYEGPLN